jgi:hypothetical protein
MTAGDDVDEKNNDGRLEFKRACDWLLEIPDFRQSGLAIVPNPPAAHGHLNGGQVEAISYSTIFPFLSI